VFSFYIDWFNPFMNKIAGKSASCGAIIAVCLNLPYEMWHLEGYTYFVGMTPPKEPTVTAMAALADPIVEQFQEMWHGKMVPTYNHPEGDFYRAAIIATIGDILALKKLLGCAGHTSHNFCSFCKLQYADIDRLDYADFEPRVGWEVLRCAKAWLVAGTVAARKKIFNEHRCRFSPLNRLTYRDPVKHTVLAPMHNWLQGVLQHHCCLKWGIGSNGSKAGGASAFDAASDSDSDSNVDKDVDMMDVDDNTIETELEDLHRDSFRNDRPSSSLARRASFMVMSEAEDAAEPGREEEEEDEEDEDENVDGDADDYTVYEKGRPSQIVFDADAMAIIHAGLAGVVIPAWIDRPPINLGEKTHGKLKADNWFVLFAIFFPLIIPELWYHRYSLRMDLKLLDNFHDVVGATNILCSYTTTPSGADQYTEIYLNYLRSSQSLFPGLTTRPNHHYAMHNGDQMKWWGPLMKLSEFM
jgi:hypothetical protein